MRLLITRTLFSCEQFAKRLRAFGHSVISSPMLEIKFLTCPQLDPQALQGLIITSAHSLMALEHSRQIIPLFDVPVFAVGEASGKLARSLGFTRVVAGASGADELVEIITGHARREGGPLVHLCGNVRAVDVEALLKQRGFDVSSVVNYLSSPARALSLEATEALSQEGLDLVVLMSPRTAKTYGTLVIKAGLDKQARQVNYACISKTTARALEVLDIPPGCLHTPARPQSSELLALINRLSSQSG